GEGVAEAEVDAADPLAGGEETRPKPVYGLRGQARQPAEDRCAGHGVCRGLMDIRIVPLSPLCTKTGRHGETSLEKILMIFWPKCRAQMCQLALWYNEVLQKAGCQSHWRRAGVGRCVVQVE